MSPLSSCLQTVCMSPYIAIAPTVIHVAIRLRSPIQITQNLMSAHMIRIASIRSRIMVSTSRHVPVPSGPWRTSQPGSRQV